ncbi:DUF5955 family protein [Actinoplanes sp. NPDC051343]|uniref:DUF5955 family protein n=1 Tax=Actinoplanes sp. NPDC051343 TaxID=3363906 RepID=UPI0037B08A3D
MSNEIRIGGSAYGAIANGPKARAVQRDVSINHAGGGSEAFLSALAAFRTLVDQNADRIPEAAKVRKDAQSIEDEFRSPEIDAPAMRDTIVRIIGRVGMVGTVLEAANNLRELIDTLVH